MGDTPTILGRQGLIPVLGIGLVAGVMEVAVALSFSALLFADLGAGAYARGAGFVLLGTVVANLTVSSWSSIPGALVVPQDTSTAILAAAAAPILVSLDRELRLGSMILYVAAATILTGLVMLLIGVIRRGGLVRFVPLPVIGGFLAGTGYLLIVGGADVITGGFAFTAASVVALVGGCLFAVIMAVVIRFRPRPVLVPGGVLAGVALFFLLLVVSGTSVDEARALGLLVEPARTSLGLPLTELQMADWSILQTGWGGLVTVPLVATLGMLLNVSALEMLSRQDADLDRELRMVGTANLAGGVTGTPAVYHTLGMSALGYRVGVKSRLVPVVVAGLCLLAAGVGGPVFSLLPVPVIGGLLIFIGIGFVTDWFVDRRRQMTRAEVVLMGAIVVAVATVGFLVAVGLGMVVAVILFAIRYAGIDPVRHHGDATEMRSTVDRPRAAEAVLARDGDTILVVQLHGYLFFGSAKLAVDRIASLMDSRERLRVVVVDLERVTGADATGISSLLKLVDLSLQRAEAFVMSRLPDALAGELGPVLAALPKVTVSPDLDHALETAEEVVLGGLGAPDEFSWQETFGEETWSRLQEHVRRVEVAAGDVVITEGETSQGVLMVERGRLVTEIPTNGAYRRVRSSGPGAVVGEMSLYRSGVRSARVSAAEPTVLIELDGDTIARIESHDPKLALRLHRVLASVMAERVAQGNAAVSALLR